MSSGKKMHLAIYNVVAVTAGEQASRALQSSAGDWGLTAISAEQERGNLPVLLQEGGKEISYSRGTIHALG